MEPRKAPLEPRASGADGPAVSTHAALIFGGGVVEVVDEVDALLVVGGAAEHFHIL